jgi:hypothetical protein
MCQGAAITNATTVFDLILNDVITDPRKPGIKYQDNVGFRQHSVLFAKVNVNPLPSEQIPEGETIKE